MILYRDQKILSAVVYFADEFKKRRGYYPRQTWIYKFLALLDFGVLLKTGIPCLGLNYVAMERGPVPWELYDSWDCLKSDTFEFVRTHDGGWRVEIRGGADLDVFSDDELDEMDSILNAYAAEGVDLNGLIEEAHRKIRSWRVAWEQARQLGKRKMFMEFADEFGDDLKKPDTCPVSSEQDVLSSDSRDRQAMASPRIACSILACPRWSGQKRKSKPSSQREASR